MKLKRANAAFKIHIVSDQYRRVFSILPAVSVFLMVALTIIVSDEATGKAKTAQARGASKVARNIDAMTLQEARLYMVQLINRDRQKNGLRPVALDATATRAGQKHADVMLSLGAHGHWEQDGTKPTQRYNWVGGTDYVAENAAWFGATTSAQKPDPNAKFSREQIAGLESLWMHSDGHRRNILDKDRTHVGVGLSSSQYGISVFATQEFINKYGNIAKIPDRAYRGQRVPIGGSLSPGYRAQAILIKREEFPRRMSVAQLNATNSYSNAEESVADIFARDMSITNSGFAASIEIKRDWKPGLYYAFIWAEDSRGEKVPVSVLTFYVL